MNILIKWPTRQRPALFRQSLEKWRAYLSGQHAVHFVVTCDDDDATMQTPEMIAYMDGIDNLAYRFGDSRSKVEAINADVSGPDSLALPDWQILILASDDMIPVERGFDDIVARDMQKHFPDLSGGLWYNDGGLGGDKLWTLAIMGRGLFDRLGYIYLDQYKSVYVDNDVQEVCRRIGKVKYIPRTIIKHEWVNASGPDALHKRNENPALYARDRAVFERRKAAGFPIK
jgi:hypothetical protein